MLQTERRRLLQPLWSALDAHLGPRLAQGHVALLAVSGGPDSRALLEAAARWPARTEALRVASVDHGTRGESRAEAVAVAARARALGFDGAVLTVRRAPGDDDEAALREARYRALVDHASLHDVHCVVLAHHAGDVAESALLSWLGQGGAGAAMPSVGQRGPVALVRPFLALSREQLRMALAACGCDDSFADPDAVSMRARLRRERLAPLGAGRAPVEQSLARAAGQRRDDEDALAAAAAATVTRDPDGGARIVVDVERAGHAALLRRALRMVLSELGAGDVRSSAPAVETVVELAGKRARGSVHLRGAVAEVRPGPSGGGISVDVRARTVADLPAATHDGQGRPHSPKSGAGLVAVRSLVSLSVEEEE